jgi:O-acetyl-ADP-ribose deacetylase (regulator of RNase III)
MSLIKLAATIANKEALKKTKKYLLNGLALTGVGTGLYGDALLLKKMLKK